MDEWPPVKCPRFDGESLDVYRRRQQRVVEIVTNFRRGIYQGELADRMEDLLESLRNPAFEEA